ncbi:MAG TPA: OmpA family protein, partial [Nannocystis sp.]
MFARSNPKASAKLALALATALTTGACAASLAPLPAPDPAPTASAERVEHRHEVLFAIDQAEASPGELVRLDAFLAQLPTGSIRRFRLIAHADEPAGETYNLALSARRARAVERHLRARLPARDEIATTALGERSSSRLAETPGPVPRD